MTFLAYSDVTKVIFTAAKTDIFITEFYIQL